MLQNIDLIRFKGRKDGGSRFETRFQGKNLAQNRSSRKTALRMWFQTFAVAFSIHLYSVPGPGSEAMAVDLHIRHTDMLPYLQGLPYKVRLNS